MTITGMKVKGRQLSTGLYAWVIVGPDEQVITFERGIAWDSSQHRRLTQMWLHDAWIAARDGFAPQPGPLAAPARTVGAVRGDATAAPASPPSRRSP